MRFGLRSKSFAMAFSFAMTTGLSFGVHSVSFADDVVPAVKTVESSAYLNQLFSKQWVRLSDKNSITGSLVQLTAEDKQAVAGLPVALVKDGQVAYRALADQNGSFTFRDVEVGSYSLVARTNESIAAFSLQVLDASNAHLTSEVEVRVVRPAGTKVKEILRSQALPTYAVVAPSAPMIEKDPLGESRTFSKSQWVKANADGKLLGQLGSVGNGADMSDMQIYVLKDGQEVAKARVEKDGSFQVDGLKPGIYGFIAAGNSGFAATSFELVTEKSVAAKSADGSRLVSIFGNACNHMNVEVVQCSEVVACEAPVQVVEESIVEAPIVEACGEMVIDECGAAPSCGCGGGFGGGWGGGGGGGGIGGGWGAIAGIAGLATVAGILAAEDDNNDAVVVSPIQ
jgi:hypothetical protein